MWVSSLFLPSYILAIRYIYILLAISFQLKSLSRMSDVCVVFCTFPWLVSRVGKNRNSPERARACFDGKLFTQLRSVTEKIFAPLLAKGSSNKRTKERTKKQMRQIIVSIAACYSFCNVTRLINFPPCREHRFGDICFFSLPQQSDLNLATITTISSC